MFIDNLSQIFRVWNCPQKPTLTPSPKEHLYFGGLVFYITISLNVMWFPTTSWLSWNERRLYCLQYFTMRTPKIFKAPFRVLELQDSKESTPKWNEMKLFALDNSCICRQPPTWVVGNHILYLLSSHFFLPSWNLRQCCPNHNSALILVIFLPFGQILLVA